MGCQAHECCELVDNERAHGIFKPMKDRCCTDIFCLLIFLIYFVLMIVIAVFSSGPGGGNIDYLRYPLDYNNQFCGKTGDVANRTKAYYPRLDKDITEQWFILTSPVGFYNFVPYTLCVDTCPEAYSLANPQMFGGPLYPGAGSDDTTFYATLGTREIFSRCLPVTNTMPSSNRDLCGFPNCTTAQADLQQEFPAKWANAPANNGGLGAAACTVDENKIDSQPDVTSAWVLDRDSLGDLYADADAYCKFKVQEHLAATFYPDGANAETKAKEMQYAQVITSAFSVLKGITDNAQAELTMGVLAPFIFGGVWFVLLFFFAGFIIYLALLLLLGFMLISCLYLYYKAGLADDVGVDFTMVTNFTSDLGVEIFPEADAGDLPQSWYAALAALATLTTVIYLILLVLWRHAISRCIAIVREVTKILMAMPLMMAWPLVGTFWTAFVLIYGLIFGGFIVTSGTQTFSDIQAALDEHSNQSATAGAGYTDQALEQLTSLSADTQKLVLLGLHVVGIIWALFIVQAATYTTLARAAAVWYFNHEEQGGRVIQAGKFYGGVRVVVVSGWCIFTRHLGSIAFGAAILTLVTLVKMVLMAIDKYTQDLQDKNMMLKIVMKCSHYCVWCLEKTIKFITYFGFIFVAVEGSNFCSACWQTMQFWMRYPAQITVNKLVAHLLSLVISLSIPVGCALICFVWVDQTGGYEPMWAAAATFLMAFLIASAVTDVLRCCIDTIFICAFKDMEEHSPPKFMSDSLQGGFGINPADRARFNSLDQDSKTGKALSTPSGGAGTELNARM